jgi:uncharacterized membrane protein
MWTSPAELHAALNDFPPALFVAAMVFQLAGAITGRESLKAAGFWTLIASAVGAVVAVVTGLRAEDVIAHGSATHRFIERHQTLAISFTVLVVFLALWQVVRGSNMTSGEGKAYGAAMFLGFLGILWTGSVGGQIVFEHAGGIETSVLQSSLEDREAGHVHGPGEADHEHAPGTPDHEHPPGTPEHEHATDGAAAADTAHVH